MKKLTILLLTFSLALGCLMLWQWTHTELVVSARFVRTVPAAEMKSNYEAVARAVRNGSLQGIVYHADALWEMNGCYFRFFTLTLQNRGLLPAEMTELQLSPFPEDICAYLSREEIIIPPGLTIGIDCGPLPGQKLPDLPPIEYDLSEEEAEEIRKKIAKSLRIRLKLGVKE